MGNLQCRLDYLRLSSAALGVARMERSKSVMGAHIAEKELYGLSSPDKNLLGITVSQSENLNPLE